MGDLQTELPANVQNATGGFVGKEQHVCITRQAALIDVCIALGLRATNTFSQTGDTHTRQHQSDTGAKTQFDYILLSHCLRDEARN